MVIDPTAVLAVISDLANRLAEAEKRATQLQGVITQMQAQAAEQHPEPGDDR